MDMENTDNAKSEAIKSSFDLIEQSFLDVGISHNMLLQAGVPEEEICAFIEKQVKRADKIAHGDMKDMLDAMLARMMMSAKRKEEADKDEVPKMPF